MSIQNVLDCRTADKVIFKEHFAPKDDSKKGACGDAGARCRAPGHFIVPNAHCALVFIVCVFVCAFVMFVFFVFFAYVFVYLHLCVFLCLMCLSFYLFADVYMILWACVCVFFLFVSL